jgi:dTDP-4-dehydrorhamnose reductase
VKVLVTGAGGMLARALAPALERRGHEVAALPRAALDVTRGQEVRDRILKERPAVVVQCAAYTAVDRAETDEETARRVNADATGSVAAACQELGALLVYPSTDYVFSGAARRPYRPGDPTGPLSAYGRTKLAGEEAARQAGRALIVRTSWLYGPGGASFVETILRLAGERAALDVVDDQVGRPTSTPTLAETIAELLEAGAEGEFHATDGGDAVSWFGLAREIVAATGLPTEVRPVASIAFPRPAPRPAYSVLDCTATEAAIGRAMHDWKDALAHYLRGRSG